MHCVYFVADRVPANTDQNEHMDRQRAHLMWAMEAALGDEAQVRWIRPVSARPLAADPDAYVMLMMNKVVAPHVTIPEVWHRARPVFGANDLVIAVDRTAEHVRFVLGEGVVVWSAVDASVLDPDDAVMAKRIADYAKTYFSRQALDEQLSDPQGTPASRTSRPRL